MNQATLTNCLLRCRRSDEKPKGVFERVFSDPQIWVLELENHFSEIIKTLEKHRNLLADLNGSEDYTLYICAELTGKSPLKLPLDVVDIASTCGFTIELQNTIE